MNAFNFGDPNLFVQGIVEQTMYDPVTGDVLAYDNVGNDAALNYTFDLTEITGGFNNQLVGVIPHTTRLTGTYTSAAFSMRQRALLSGGQLSYNATTAVVETITATSTSLTVSKTPALSYAQPATDTYAWCQVREHGATSYSGVNYGVSIEDGLVQNFVAESGKTYDVFYFAKNASSQVLGLPASANSTIVSIQQKRGVYAKQNGSVSQGTLQGYLYIFVPRAMLEGDAGVDGTQTTNSTTSYNWRALTPNSNMPSAMECGASSDNIAYYIYTPCGSAVSAVKSLVVIGGSISVAVNASKQIPVKYVMPDDSLVQPTYTDMEYTVSTANATVNTNGVVTGATAGNAVVTITLGDLTTQCNVTVTSA